MRQFTVRTGRRHVVSSISSLTSSFEDLNGLKNEWKCVREGNSLSQTPSLPFSPPPSQRDTTQQTGEREGSVGRSLPFYTRNVGVLSAISAGWELRTGGLNRQPSRNFFVHVLCFGSDFVRSSPFTTIRTLECS